MSLICEGIDTMERHGHIDEALFTRLSTTFPKRKPDIVMVARTWGIMDLSTKKDDPPSSYPINQPPRASRAGSGKIRILIHNTSFNLDQPMTVASDTTFGEVCQMIMDTIRALPELRGSLAGFQIATRLAYNDEVRGQNARLCDAGVASGHTLHLHITARPVLGGEAWEPRALLFSGNDTSTDESDPLLVGELFSALRRSELTEG